MSLTRSKAAPTILSPPKRGAVAAKAAQQIVDRLCNGSLEEALIGMVNNAAIDPRQLPLLSNKIAKNKPRGRCALELIVANEAQKIYLFIYLT